MMGKDNKGDQNKDIVFLIGYPQIKNAPHRGGGIDFIPVCIISKYFSVSFNNKKVYILFWITTIFLLPGDPKGTRTPVPGVRGRWY